MVQTVLIWRWKNTFALLIVTSTYSMCNHCYRQVNPLLFQLLTVRTANETIRLESIPNRSRMKLCAIVPSPHHILQSAISTRGTIRLCNVLWVHLMSCCLFSPSLRPKKSLKVCCQISFGNVLASWDTNCPGRSHADRLISQLISSQSSHVTSKRKKSSNFFTSLRNNQSILLFNLDEFHFAMLDSYYYYHPNLFPTYSRVQWSI